MKGSLAQHSFDGAPEALSSNACPPLEPRCCRQLSIEGPRFAVNDGATALYEQLSQMRGGPVFPLAGDDGCPYLRLQLSNRGTTLSPSVQHCCTMERKIVRNRRESGVTGRVNSCL